MWSFSSVLDTLIKLAQLTLAGFGAYRMFNPPTFRLPPPPPPPPPPELPKFEFPEFEFPSFETPPLEPPPPNYEAIAQRASRARADLQSRGVFSGGAVSIPAMLPLIGEDDPETVAEALRRFGPKYGWPATMPF